MLQWLHSKVTKDVAEISVVRRPFKNKLKKAMRLKVLTTGTFRPLRAAGHRVVSFQTGRSPAPPVQNHQISLCTSRPAGQPVFDVSHNLRSSFGNLTISKFTTKDSYTFSYQISFEKAAEKFSFPSTKKKL